MRKHQLKMNPLKCAFGVSTEIFLCFLVQAMSPSDKEELQRLLGQINFLKIFL